MRPVLLLFLPLFTTDAMSQPVFKNPGLPNSESFEIHEYVDPQVGYALTRVNITLEQRNGEKYYKMNVYEGNAFLNEIELRYTDLTTLSEKRTDLRTNTVIQYYIKKGNTIRFYNKEKGVDKTIESDETNIYSPLAYLLSFRGFPFDVGRSTSFKTYMYQYGGELTMNLVNTGTEKETVKAGTFNCYVLVLSVGGWQSFFATDKYYFYFTVASPHIFVKYKEYDNGVWNADELISYDK